ncbi:STAS/SEC14 domain-containing protein [Microbulbifer taiwanensis]|uniref:STAS/SEC14 domain-containing protein n=1 Tax=Microbulbifer taiwanensis TaxID=986746 RepID=A0ABW1YRX8_9GAMM|nr:STAS/SEC14 domain-containing protein [Microbulbifer taiwanensis]
MFKVERAGENRLDITISGKLDSEEMKQALDALVTKSDGIEKGKMLFDIIEYKLPSIGAIGIELSRLPSMLGFIRKFSKAAVLTDEDWIGKTSEMEAALIPGLEIRAFSRSRKADAKAWLNSDPV